MAAPSACFRLTPEDESDEIVVSKKGLEERKRPAAQAKEPARENERLRKEIAELRRRLQVHENPNVPPSVRSQAPGHTRAHSLTPPERHKRPGAKRGHPGTTREGPPPDEEFLHTAPVCGKCRSPRLKLIGQQTTTETELPTSPKPKVTKHTQNLYRCEERGEETLALALPPDGRQPTGWGLVRAPVDSYTHPGEGLGGNRTDRDRREAGRATATRPGPSVSRASELSRYHPGQRGVGTRCGSPPTPRGRKASRVAVRRPLGNAGPVPKLREGLPPRGRWQGQPG
jgi:hypothetical protein